MKHTEATKRKLSKMRSGKNNPFYGKHHTAATKRKMATATRRFNSQREYDIIPSTVRVPTGPDRAYLAGLIDGEGSIRLRRKVRPFVAIYNGDWNLKDWLALKTLIEPKWNDYRGRVRGWQWLIQSAANVYLVCCELLPFLIVKKKDAEKAIRFLEDKYGRTRIRREAFHGRDIEY